METYQHQNAPEPTGCLAVFRAQLGGLFRQLRLPPRPIPVSYGMRFEAEFFPGRTSHRYTITCAPGDRLIVCAEPIGQTLDVDLRLLDPEGTPIFGRNTGIAQPVELDCVVSSSGVYTINPYGDRGSIGAYILSISCMRRDGTVIEPGSVPFQASASFARPSGARKNLSGAGFSGQPSVDFSNAERRAVPPDIPINGLIDPASSQKQAFVFEAAAGDALNLRFMRLTGNLNLELAIVFEDDTPVFQASLVTSDVLSTHLTLPLNGQYTIGVFPIALMPPADPQPTAYQIQRWLTRD